MAACNGRGIYQSFERGRKPEDRSAHISGSRSGKFGSRWVPAFQPWGDEPLVGPPDRSRTRHKGVVGNGRVFDASRSRGRPDRTTEE